MITAVVLREGPESDPVVVQLEVIEAIGAHWEVLLSCFPEGLDPAELRVVHLRRQQAVVLYDGTAMTGVQELGSSLMAGPHLNVRGTDLLPAQERRLFPDQYVHGPVVVLGAADTRGEWTSVPGALQADLLLPTAFWVEVSARPGWDFERVSPPCPTLQDAWLHQLEWDAELSCEGFEHACTRVVGEHRDRAPDPSPVFLQGPLALQVFRHWDRHGEWPMPQTAGKRFLYRPLQAVYAFRRAVRARARRAWGPPRCLLRQRPQQS